MEEKVGFFAGLFHDPGNVKWCFNKNPFFFKAWAFLFSPFTQINLVQSLNKKSLLISQEGFY
jgi:hypothetical protein